MNNDRANKEFGASVNPLIRIRLYFEELTQRKQLAPMCLSTISSQGYPASRFVDLKAVTKTGLLFGTDERSRKAKEFTRNTKVASCAWWTELGVQIRVQGHIFKASRETSDRIFESRNSTAKAIATLSIQSSPLESLESLAQKVESLVEQTNGRIDRPPTWWVFEITPEEIEILQFSKDRIHLRTRFSLENGIWNTTLLSP